MSTYTDPLFPFPEPTFMWVYDLVLHPQTAASVVVDDNGKWHYAAEASVGFTGYIGAANPREVERAASRGEIIDAVALCPNETDARTEWDLTAGAGVPTIFVGRYTIIGVRPNPSHTRLLLTRITGEDPQHA